MAQAITEGATVVVARRRGVAARRAAAEPFEGDEAESIQDVAVVDGELLLVGWVDADAAVWRAPLPG